VRLHVLYAVAALAIVAALVLAALLREDCTKRTNELDIALCMEQQ
jgi:hypothetical protein